MGLYRQDGLEVGNGLFIDASRTPVARVDDRVVSRQRKAVKQDLKSLDFNGFTSCKDLFQRMFLRELLKTMHGGWGNTRHPTLTKATPTPVDWAPTFLDDSRSHDRQLPSELHPGWTLLSSPQASKIAFNQLHLSSHLLYHMRGSTTLRNRSLTAPFSTPVRYFTTAMVIWTD